MQLYDNVEIDRIEKIKSSNDKMESFFEVKREEWTKNMQPIFDIISTKIDINSSDKILNSQSLALTYRQVINEQITFFLNKRSKEEVKLKKIKQDKFLFYSIGIGSSLKTNTTEKTIMIDAHLSESERSMQLIESHIEFLRTCSKNLEGFGFTIKNMIDLMNTLNK